MMRPCAVTWHEAIAGRSAEEICSAFLLFINSHRDVENIIFWADNCSSQNKSWCLHTLCILVNSKNGSALQSITVKYFEKGHTFMSADSYHHLVELAMTRMKKVYDFKDFCVALESDGWYTDGNKID